MQSNDKTNPSPSAPVWDSTEMEPPSVPKKRTLKAFAKGTRVIYKKNSQKPEIATIVAVHLDDLPHFVYYTIRLEDGRERQTQDIYLEELKPIKKEDEDWAKASTDFEEAIKEQFKSEGEKKKINSFNKGDEVLYTNKATNNSELVTIVGVHLDNLPDFIYYTIKFEDGREKQTRDMYLRKPIDVIFWKDSIKMHTKIEKIEGSVYTIRLYDYEVEYYQCDDYCLPTGDKIKTGRENLLFIADRISKPVKNAAKKFENPSNFRPTQDQIDAISYCAKLRNMKVVDVGFGLESQYNAVAYSLKKLQVPRARSVQMFASSRVSTNPSLGKARPRGNPDNNIGYYFKNPEDMYSYNGAPHKWPMMLMNPRTQGVQAGDGWPGAATLYAAANQYNCVINVLTDYGTKNNVISIIPEKLILPVWMDEWEGWRDEWKGPYTGGGTTGSKPQVPKKAKLRPDWHEIWIAYLDRHHYMALEPMPQNKVKGGKSRKVTKKTSKKKYKVSRKARKSRKQRKLKKRKTRKRRI